MAKSELISIEKIIVHHNLDEEFIANLELYQLIEFVTIDTGKYLHQKELPALEKIIRLHYDLKINMEGIDVINHMTERIKRMQRSILHLENKLKLYEQ